MVKLAAHLTHYFGEVENVVRASSADAARAIPAVWIDVLTKRKLRPPPLLGPNSHG